MKAHTRELAQALYHAALSGTYASMSAGHEPNFELLSAQAIEAALEFERKCEQEDENQCVSRVANLKRAYKAGYGMHQRGEPCPSEPYADEIAEEVMHGWRRAQHDAEEKASQAQNHN